MTAPVPPDVLRKVRNLAQLPGDARRSRFALPVTRLTVLKSLGREPELANRFVIFLARKTLGRVRQGKGRSSRRGSAKSLAHRQMMTEALAAMEAWLHRPDEARRARLRELLGRIQAEQNEYENIPWGAVRLVTDWDLLLFEYALRCLLGLPHEAGSWAYRTARHYAERSDARHGSGLTPASAPLLQDIADFWVREMDLDPAALAGPAEGKKTVGEKRPSPRTGKDSTARRQKARFTRRQGQFLAFIHLYRQLHRQGPAESDLVQYFRVTPPAAHGMVVRLEQQGLVTRQPGVPRSVRVAIPEEEIPQLEGSK